MPRQPEKLPTIYPSSPRLKEFMQITVPLHRHQEEWIVDAKRTDLHGTGAVEVHHDDETISFWRPISECQTSRCFAYKMYRQGMRKTDLPAIFLNHGTTRTR